jgi:hypothetical protein
MVLIEFDDETRLKAEVMTITGNWAGIVETR